MVKAYLDYNNLIFKLGELEFMQSFNKNGHS
jgi:hypothetical protein